MTIFSFLTCHGCLNLNLSAMVNEVFNSQYHWFKVSIGHFHITFMSLPHNNTCRGAPSYVVRDLNITQTTLRVTLLISVIPKLFLCHCYWSFSHYFLCQHFPSSTSDVLGISYCYSISSQTGSDVSTIFFI